MTVVSSPKVKVEKPKIIEEDSKLLGSIFVGSRACAANHYVIAEKCPYQ